VLKLRLEYVVLGCSTERRARRANPDARRVRGSLAAGRRGALARLPGRRRPGSAGRARRLLPGVRAERELGRVCVRAL